MHLIAPTILFMLNLIDGLLTIVWVRAGVATEANHLMGGLLDIGDLPFLAFKIAMGTFAAVVFYCGGDRPLAKYGLALALAIYISLMGIHIVTGLTVMGYVSSSELHEWIRLPGDICALIT